MDISFHHSYRRIVCTSCGFSFDAPIRCDDRFCEVCGRIRRRRIFSRIHQLLKLTTIVRGRWFRHIVLTVPNSPDLKAATEDLLASFRRLRQRSWWKSLVSGGMYVLEVNGRPGDFHPHLHVIAYSRYLPKRQLSYEWSQCSPGRIVRIRYIRNKRVASYLTAYLSDLKTPRDIRLTISEALRGKRFFSSFGEYHQLISTIPEYNYECPICGSCTWEPLDRVVRHSHQPFMPRPGRSPPAGGALTCPPPPTGGQVFWENGSLLNPSHLTICRGCKEPYVPRPNVCDLSHEICCRCCSGWGNCPSAAVSGQEDVFPDLRTQPNRKIPWSQRIRKLYSFVHDRHGLKPSD